MRTRSPDSAGDVARPRTGAVVAATKLHVPAPRRGLVPRRALVALLDAGLERPLTLVAAPAGSGKTTLLAEWHAAARRRVAFAWLSLDPEDNDPVRFWGCVLDALRTAEPGIGRGAEAALRAPGTTLEADVLPLLVNELLELPRRVVLVLDDYHLVRDERIHASLRFLLEHMPPSLHLALATRADPPLPVGRFRARDLLTEVRIGDLRFSDEQAAALLNGTLGLDLDRGSVERLRRRTEGWAAGLQLAGLSLRGRRDPAAFIASFAGDDRHVVDYLGAEVLDTLEPELLRFAVRTSVLERLSSQLCRAVTGDADAADRLEALERMNLFVVPLDEHRRWFRWHHLFGELLRYRLDRDEPAHVEGLHARAAAWYADAGLPDEAVRHALAARDDDAAADLVAAHWSSVFNRGRLETVSRWLEALPRVRVLADERLWLARVWTLLDSGRLDEVEPWLDARAGDDWSELLRALHAFKRGRLPVAADAERWGRGAAGNRSPFWRTVASCLGGVTLFWHGELEAAAPVLARGVEIARDDANTVAAVYQLGYLALVEIELQRPERAEALLARADALVGAEPQAGEHFTAAMAHLARARLLAAGPAADHERARAEELARRGAGAVELAATQAPGRPRGAPAAGELSERELEVLRLMATRLSQREIGATLYVSLNTVKSHAKSIFRKLDASTRSQAVARARELGLL